MSDNFPEPRRFRFADYDVTLELRERQVPSAPTPTPDNPRPWRAYRWTLHGSAKGRAELDEAYPDLTEDGETIYLLSLVVALEWHPSLAYLAQLRRAFRLASDYLYDVTDGRMAFEQIEFVGHEQRHRAHVVVLASNRIHPRCQMEGLHHEVYPSITLGRGLWLPRYEMSLPWDEPEGYRTIIHEIAHAALGLPDAYLTRIAINYETGRQVPRNTRVAKGMWIPAYTPDSYSMMGWPLIGSELTYAERQLRKLFYLEPEQTDGSGGESVSPQTATEISPHIKQGPLALPLPFPEYLLSLAQGGRGSDAPPTEASLILRGNVTVRHYDEAWLYLWRPDAGYLLAQGTCLVPPRPGEVGYEEGMETFVTPLPGSPPLLADRLPTPRPSFPPRHEPERGLVEEDGEGRASQLLPETHSYRCELVGVQVGDRVLLVVEEAGMATRVYGGTVETLVGGEVWLNDLTPPGPLPLLCVVPTEREPEVCIEGGSGAPDALWLFPLGGAAGIELKNPTETAGSLRYAVPERHLDGHLLTRWGEGEEARFLVTMFSQGGTGPGHDQVTSPPSAGALDGSAMLFFGDRPMLSGESEGALGEAESPFTLLTTQGHRSEDEPQVGSGPVTLASNQSLSEADEPTLVFFYQGSALGLGEYFGRRPVIQRWGEMGNWEALSPVYVTTRRLIAAVPLTVATAPTLFDKAGGVERYRLIWV